MKKLLIATIAFLVITIVSIIISKLIGVDFHDVITIIILHRVLLMEVEDY